MAVRSSFSERVDEILIEYVPNWSNQPTINIAGAVVNYEKYLRSFAQQLVILAHKRGFKHVQVGRNEDFWFEHVPRRYMLELDNKHIARFMKE